MPAHKCTIRQREATLLVPVLHDLNRIAGVDRGCDHRQQLFGRTRCHLDTYDSTVAGSGISPTCDVSAGSATSSWTYCERASTSPFESMSSMKRRSTAPLLIAAMCTPR